MVHHTNASRNHNIIAQFDGLDTSFTQQQHALQYFKLFYHIHYNTIASLCNEFSIPPDRISQLYRSNLAQINPLLVTELFSPSQYRPDQGKVFIDFAAVRFAAFLINHSPTLAISSNTHPQSLLDTALSLFQSNNSPSPVEPFPTATSQSTSYQSGITTQSQQPQYIHYPQHSQCTQPQQALQSVQIDTILPQDPIPRYNTHTHRDYNEIQPQSLNQVPTTLFPAFPPQNVSIPAETTSGLAYDETFHQLMGNNTSVTLNANYINPSNNLISPHTTIDIAHVACNTSLHNTSTTISETIKAQQSNIIEKQINTNPLPAIPTSQALSSVQAPPIPDQRPAISTASHTLDPDNYDNDHDNRDQNDAFHTNGYKRQKLNNVATITTTATSNTNDLTPFHHQLLPSLNHPDRYENIDPLPSEFVQIGDNLENNHPHPPIPLEQTLLPPLIPSTPHNKITSPQIHQTTSPQQNSRCSIGLNFSLFDQISCSAEDYQPPREDHTFNISIPDPQIPHTSPHFASINDETDDMFDDDDVIEIISPQNINIDTSDFFYDNDENNQIPAPQTSTTVVPLLPSPPSPPPKFETISSTPNITSTTPMSTQPSFAINMLDSDEDLDTLLYKNDLITSVTGSIKTTQHFNLPRSPPLTMSPFAPLTLLHEGNCINLKSHQATLARAIKLAKECSDDDFSFLLHHMPADKLNAHRAHWIEALTCGVKPDAHMSTLNTVNPRPTHQTDPSVLTIPLERRENVRLLTFSDTFRILQTGQGRRTTTGAGDGNNNLTHTFTSSEASIIHSLELIVNHDPDTRYACIVCHNAPSMPYSECVEHLQFHNNYRLNCFTHKTSTTHGDAYSHSYINTHAIQYYGCVECSILFITNPIHPSLALSESLALRPIGGPAIEHIPDQRPDGPIYDYSLPVDFSWQNIENSQKISKNNRPLRPPMINGRSRVLELMVAHHEACHSLLTWYGWQRESSRKLDRITFRSGVNRAVYCIINDRQCIDITDYSLFNDIQSYYNHQMSRLRIGISTAIISHAALQYYEKVIASVNRANFANTEKKSRSHPKISLGCRIDSPGENHLNNVTADVQNIQKQSNSSRFSRSSSIMWNEGDEDDNDEDLFDEPIPSRVSAQKNISQTMPSLKMNDNQTVISRTTDYANLQNISTKKGNNNIKPVIEIDSSFDPVIMTFVKNPQNTTTFVNNDTKNPTLPPFLQNRKINNSHKQRLGFVSPLNFTSHKSKGPGNEKKP